MIKIYVLRDPSTHEVVYVGKTSKTLTERLEQHIYHASGMKTPRDKWIIRLAEQDKEPVIELLEVVTGNWEERERYWIQYYNIYRLDGGKLSNATIGGLGVKTK